MTTPQHAPRSRSRVALRVLVGAAMVVALPSISGAPAQALPAVSVDPLSGPPGATVDVTGSDFTPGIACRLYLTVSTQPPPAGTTSIDTCVVAGDRRLTGDFVVPNVAPSGYQLWACVGTGACADEFTERASTPFTVTPPPTTTATTTTTTTSTTTTSTTTTTRPPTPPPSTTTEPPRPTAPPTTAGPPSTTGPTTPPATLPPITLPPATTVVPPVTVTPPSTSEPLGPLFPTGGGTCTVPPTADVLDYDGLSPGSPHSLLLGGTTSGSFGEVVVPTAGTASDPNGLLLRTDDVFATIPVEVNGHNEELRRTGADPQAPLHYLGFVVGLDSTHDEPVQVTLFGYGVDGRGDVLVDVDRVVLGPGPTPVRECLLVRSGGAAEIFRVFVTSSVPGARIVIDDRFFGRDPHPDPRPPIVLTADFIYPDEGADFDASRSIPLLAEIRSPVPLELDEVVFDVPDARDPAATVELAPTATSGWFGGGAGGSRMLVALDGVHLPPGEQTVSLRVTDDRGATSATRTLTVTGEPFLGDQAYRDEIAGTVDIVPWAMEITQAVRGPLDVQAPGTEFLDDFPMVANKPTVVRGYAVQQFEPGEAPTRIEALTQRARLYGTRNGVPLPDSPLLSPPARLFELEPGPDAELRMRPYALYTFNFELPDDWTNAGPVSLELEVNPPGLTDSVEEREGTDGPANRIGRTTVFTEIGTASLIVYPVAMRSRCDDELVDLFMTEGASPLGTTTTCTSTDVNFTQTPDLTELPDAIGDWWKWMPAAGRGPVPVRTLPTLSMFNANSPPTDAPDDPTLPREMSGYRYDDIAEAIQDLDCNPELERSKLVTRGPRDPRVFLMTSGAPGFVGAGCATRGLSAAFLATPVGRTLAHEFGHTVGLKHSSDAHGESEGGSVAERWVGDHGELGPPGGEGWGFDVQEVVAVPPTAGGQHVHDLMSYGSRSTRWVGIDTWLSLFEALRTNDVIDDRRDGVGPRAEPADETDGEGAVGRAVAGLVEGDGSRGTIELVELATPLSAAGADPDLVLAALDGEGAALAELPVVVTSSTDGEEPAVWRADLPANLEPARLELRSGGDVIADAESIGEPIAPQLAVTDDGETVEVAVAAQPGVDYRFEASRVGGPWYELGANDGTTFTVDAGAAGLAGDGWELRVQADDGVQLATETVGGVDFGTPAPVAGIIGLADGDTVAPGMHRVTALSSAVGDSVRYRWSVDGVQLGEGSSVLLPLLDPASQVVELDVTNAAGTASVTVTVEVALDDDRDGLPNDWEVVQGLDPDDPADGLSDSDGDGLVALAEFRAGTQLDAIDSDGDRYTDDVEVLGGSDPNDAASVPFALLDAPGPVPRLDAEPGSTDGDGGVDVDEQAGGEEAGGAGGGSGGGAAGWIIAAVLAALTGLAVAAAFLLRRRNPRTDPT